MEVTSDLDISMILVECPAFKPGAFWVRYEAHDHCLLIFEQCPRVVYEPTAHMPRYSAAAQRVFQTPQLFLKLVLVEGRGIWVRDVSRELSVNGQAYTYNKLAR